MLGVMGLWPLAMLALLSTKAGPFSPGVLVICCVAGGIWVVPVGVVAVIVLLLFLTSTVLSFLGILPFAIWLVVGALYVACMVWMSRSSR